MRLPDGLNVSSVWCGHDLTIDPSDSLRAIEVALRLAIRHVLADDWINAKGAGDSIQITVPSGGGFGDPHKRDPKKVLEDVLDGFTTVQAAERDYGVVLVEVGGKLRIDADVTAQLRTDMSCA